MVHVLPNLPYDRTALEPHISGETLDYHHGKHHKAYVDKLNSIVGGTEKENVSLEDLMVKEAPGVTRNQAAQIWNHTFYWNCMTPNKDSKENLPTGKIAEQINKDFGSFDNFKTVRK